MTISTTIVKNSYAGNGATTVFNYNFKILSSSDLKVIIRSSTGTETTKTLNTHYTLTGVGSAGGGSITFTAGNIPTSGQTIVLIRDTTQTQSIDYVANDPFPAETHEEGLDKGIILAQELQEEVDRCIKLSRTNAMTSTEFTVGAADRANKILAFDANGEIAVTQELGTYRGNWSTATSYAGRDLVKDTSNNNIYYVNTAHTSSGSQPLSSNANSSYYTLIVDAASATTSATNAATSAAAALASQNAASSSASAASSSASAASSSASSASSSASAASSSAASAASSFDDFDDRYLGSKSSAPSLDNDGNALINGALYWNSVSAQMFVRDSGAWVAIKPTTVEQGNITTVAGISGNITTVAGISANVTSVAGNSSNINSVASNSANINTVATNSANINTVAGANANITTVAGISGAISSVASNASNISTVATDIAKVITAANDLNEATSEIDTVANAIANVDTVGTNIANVNLVGGSIANVNTVASNIGTVNDFAARYRVSATAPSTSLDLGDLYFDTTSNTMKVYSSGGFINAGSSVNGTANRYKYTATASQTTFTGADDNSNTLAYDAGFLDVYLNGIKLVNGSDFTASSGSSIVLTTGASASDILEVIAYGTFQLANFSIADANDVPPIGTAGQVLKVNSGATALEYGTIDLTNLNASNLTSGTLPDARFPATLPATSGANLTSLNASNLSSGTVSTARLGTGTALSSNFLRGDGTWNTPQAGFSGATTTSSAVDITLTSASTQVQNVTMTASGKLVILPNATTLTTKGFPVFVITNQGIYPFSIQNGAGVNILNVNPNTTITLSLLDNSTSGGIYATGTQPLFININVGTTINTGSTGLGTYLTFNEVFNGLTCDKIDSTKVLVTYHKGTSNRDVYGRVITISGNSFTSSSETILYNGSSAAADNSSSRMLNSTNGILLVDRQANTVAIPFTISGTTISVGTTSSTFGAGLSGATYSGTSRTIPLTSTLGLISNRTTTTGTDWVYRTITHNGSSAPTIGTASSSVVNFNYSAPAMVRISDTEAFTVYAGTGVPIARVITVSGSSAPTLQTANTTSTASYPDGHHNLIANSSTNFTFFRDARSTNYTVSGNTTTHVGDRESSFYNSNLTGSLSISKIAFGDYIFEYSYYGTLPFLNKRDNGFLAPITGATISSPYGGLGAGTTFATEIDSTTAFLVVSNNVDTIRGSVIKYIGA